MIANQKKIAGEGTHHSNDDTQYAYIWDTSVNDGCGGFIMTAKRVREVFDEEEDRQPQHRPDTIPVASTETGKSEGKGAKGGKGKGKGLNPADRKSFLCGEEGHNMAQCAKDGASQRVYVAVDGTGNLSCTANEKARPRGKESQAAWQDTWDYQENEWQHIGMLGKVSKVQPTKDCVSGLRYNFNELSDTKSFRSKLILVAAKTTQSLARKDA